MRVVNGSILGVPVIFLPLLYWTKDLLNDTNSVYTHMFKCTMSIIL